MVSKITGHRSAALKRYQHLSDSFRKQTVDLIASVLAAPGTDTPTDKADLKDKGSASKNRCKSSKSKKLNGRPERTRTVDLYRVKVAL